MKMLSAIAAAACLSLLATPAALAQQGVDYTNNGMSGNDGQAPAEDGGDGGNIQVTLSDFGRPTVDYVYISASGGDGGDGLPGQPGGAAGDGGHVTLVVDTPVVSGINVDISNGVAGNGDPRGAVGAPGTADITVSSEVGTSGLMMRLPNGESVPISLAIRGGGGGVASVTLQDGAVLAGVITATGTKNVTIVFDMKVKNRAAFNEAGTYLANPDNWQNPGPTDSGKGSVTINGNTYSWVGNLSVENQLKLITKLAASNSSSSQDSSTAPDYLNCKPRGVRAIDKGAVITFNAKLPTGWFHVGDLVDQTFASTNPIGWTVTVEGTGRKQVAKVWNGDAELVSTCKL